jgi:hypothetical protein
LALQFCLFLFFCLWWPLFDPSLARLVCLPALVFFIRVRSREALVFLVLAFLLLCSVPLIEADSRRYVFLESISLLFFVLGNSYARLRLGTVVLITAFLALIFLGLQKSGVLPFQWNHPMHWLNQEFLGSTDHFPSFFSNPSPMCLFYVVGTATLKKSSLSLRILYTSLAAYPILQSGSSLGLALFLISLVYLFMEETKPLHLIMGAFLVLSCLSFLPHGETLRPLQIRAVLIQTALDSHSFIGKGPAAFHHESGAILPRDTTQQQISRNQFHPHNDWVYHLFAYGWTGAFLRLVLYGFFLILILKKPEFVPAGLGLIQFQFTPDALSIPVAPFLFFLLGQASAQCLTWPIEGHFKTGTKKMMTVLGKVLLGTAVAIYSYEALYLSWFQEQIFLGNPAPTRPPYFGSPSLCYNLAVVSIRAQKYQKAVEKLTSLQDRAPHFHDSNYLLGVANSNLGNWEAATQALSEKLRIDPYHLYSYLLLADVLERQNRIDEAKNIVRQGLVCLPNAEQLKSAYFRYSSQP